MRKFEQSQAFTSHFESFWSIVYPNVNLQACYWFCFWAPNWKCLAQCLRLWFPYLKTMEVRVLPSETMRLRMSRLGMASWGKWVCHSYQKWVVRYHTDDTEKSTEGYRIASWVTWLQNIQSWLPPHRLAFQKFFVCEI